MHAFQEVALANHCRFAFETGHPKFAHVLAHRGASLASKWRWRLEAPNVN
jgi:hypothetical protein